MVKPNGQVDTSNPDTRNRILAAAREVFQRSGFDGARTADIADMAGINKALLHYYFRSKDQLFEAVFSDAFATHFAPVLDLLSSPDLTLDEKIRRFVDAYITTLLQHPHLPGFVIHELNRNPQRLVAIATGFGRGALTSFFDQLRQGMVSGRYKTADPRQLMVSLMGMILYPFIARPLIVALFQFDERGFRDFVLTRKLEVPKQFYAMLKPT